MISVSALAKTLCQMLRQAGSGLKFCKQKLKYVGAIILSLIQNLK